MSGGQLGLAAGGPVGGAIGATAGFAAGLFGSKRKKRKPKQISTLDPQQQQLYDQYVQSIRGEGPLGGMYNYDTEGANKNFDLNVGRPAYRNFQENIIPQITGQFRSGNLQNSTYAGGALSRAGRDVQENLDAQRSNMIFGGQQQAQQNKQNAINNILGMQTFAMERPQEQKPGVIGQVLNQFAPESGKFWGDVLSQYSKAGLSGTAAPATPAAPIA
jgi:hypothetical protein